VGIPLRLLPAPTKKFAPRLRSLCRLSERTAARVMPRFWTGVAVALSQQAELATHPEQKPSHGLDSLRPPLAPCSRDEAVLRPERTSETGQRTTCWISLVANLRAGLLSRSGPALAAVR